MSEVLWQLRYRSPISPTKGVDDVQISTNSTDEARAKVVADYWLAKKMAHPSTRFVFVRRAVVQTEEDMIKELGQKSVQAAPVETDERSPAVAEARGTSSKESGQRSSRVGI
jgi:hypothetical protein